MRRQKWDSERSRTTLILLKVSTKCYLFQIEYQYCLYPLEILLSKNFKKLDGTRQHATVNNIKVPPRKGS